MRLAKSVACLSLCCLLTASPPPVKAEDNILVKSVKTFSNVVIILTDWSRNHQEDIDKSKLLPFVGTLDDDAEKLASGARAMRSSLADALLNADADGRHPTAIQITADAKCGIRQRISLSNGPLTNRCG